MARYSQGRPKRGRGPHVKGSAGRVANGLQRKKFDLSRPKPRQAHQTVLPFGIRSRIKGWVAHFNRFDENKLPPRTKNRIRRESSRLNSLVAGQLQQPLSPKEVFFALELVGLARRQKGIAPQQLAAFFSAKTGNERIGKVFQIIMKTPWGKNG
jgi:hypothetical protein